MIFPAAGISGLYRVGVDRGTRDRHDVLGRPSAHLVRRIGTAGVSALFGILPVDTQKQQVCIIQWGPKM